MSLAHDISPTKAAVMIRLKRMNEAAESGAKVARRWNPKGRYFKAQRNMIELFDLVEEHSATIIEFMGRSR